MTRVPSTERHTYDNNFTFLRLVLASLVLFTHTYTWVFGILNAPTDILTRITGNYLAFSSLAVNCFFTMSGYLLTESWIRKPNPAKFLLRRIGRIYPGFIVESLICVTLIHPLLYSEASIPRLLAFIPLLQYHQPSVVLYQVNLRMTVNGTPWTLEPEFTCYLLLLLLGITGLLPKRSVIFPLFLVVALVDTLQFAGCVSLRGLYNFYLMPHPTDMSRFAMFFLAGSCAYLFRDRYEFSGLGSAIALGACLLSLAYPPSVNFVYAFAGTYLLLAIAHARIPVLNWFKTAPDISYGIYLYGWPIQISLTYLVPHLGFWTHFFVSCLFSYVCGFLSWHLVEKHFLPKRRTRHKDPRPTAQGDPARPAPEFS